MNRPAKTWHEALENNQAYTRFQNYTIPDRKGKSGVSHDRLSSSSAGSAYDSGIASPTSEPGSPVPNDWVPVDQLHRKKPYSPSMENEFASPPKSMRKPRDEKSPRRGRRQETRSKSPSKKLRSTSKNLRNYDADKEAKEEYLAARSPPNQQ